MLKYNTFDFRIKREELTNHISSYESYSKKIRNMSETSIAFIIVAIYFSPVFYHLIIAIKESKRKNPIPLRKFIYVLKYSAIIFILLFTGFVVISHTNYLNYEKPMRYDKIDQITFENFRGLEFFKKTLYGNERMAYVVTSIESEIDENSATVESLFYPSRSYVYNSQTSSKELLVTRNTILKLQNFMRGKLKKEYLN